MAQKRKYFIFLLAFVIGQIVGVLPMCAKTADVVFDAEFQKDGIDYEITAFEKKQKEVQAVRCVTNKKVVKIPQTVRYEGMTFTVTSIADNAFCKNKKLERVEIGANVGEIGSRAFYQTKNLKFIDIRTKKLKKVGKQAFIGIHKQAKIKVPRAKKETYVNLLAKKYG